MSIVKTRTALKTMRFGFGLIKRLFGSPGHLISREGVYIVTLYYSWECIPGRILLIYSLVGRGILHTYRTGYSVSSTDC